MAITQKTSAPAIAPKETVNLELCVHSRYMLKDVLYEKDAVYTFTREQADIMLSRSSDNGLPVFRVYRPKPKRAPVNNEGRPTMDMTTHDLPPPPGASRVDHNGLHVGDMEEVADLMAEDDEDRVPV